MTKRSECRNAHLIPLLLTCLSAALGSGCATPTRLVNPSDTPGKVPPKLVYVSYWDDPSAFGKVPTELKGKGDKSCQTIGGIEATGYHPLAEGPDGVAIPGGGFYCRFPTLEEAEEREKAKRAAAAAANSAK